MNMAIGNIDTQSRVVIAENFYEVGALYPENWHTYVRHVMTQKAYEEGQMGWAPASWVRKAPKWEDAYKPGVKTWNDVNISTNRVWTGQK